MNLPGGQGQPAVLQLCVESQLGRDQQLQLGWAGAQQLGRAGAQQLEVYTDPGSVPYYAGRYNQRQRQRHGTRPPQHWSHGYHPDYHEPYWDQDQYYPLRSYLYYG